MIQFNASYPTDLFGITYVTQELKSAVLEWEQYNKDIHS